MSTARVAVLGAGSWGTALAALIARNGRATTLWGRDAAQVGAMAVANRNLRYLPEIELPATLDYSADLASTVAAADLVLAVVPSHSFPELLRELAPHRRPGVGVAWATKGFELGSGRFLHEVAEDLLGADVPTAVVTGPSFAREVAQGLPTAVTVHSEHAAFAQQVADALHGASFRAYTGNDMLGAELGGAMKNVLAVATGVSDGMQLGHNARAGLITRGLNEMLRLNAALGGRAETLMGLAGLGDLVLTCTGEASRNRTVGFEMGRGRTLDDVLGSMNQVAEGVRTAKSARDLSLELGIDMPICNEVYRVLYENKPVKQAVHDLMTRALGREW